MILAANKILTLGAKNVLIKGGHLKTKNVEDIFLNKSDLKFLLTQDINQLIRMAPDAHYQAQLQLFFHVEKVLRKLVN